jgi:catechol 2,3-dioxygenase-like lactoylglutathione lyase family enzyme
MAASILKRTTFIVTNARAAAQFYQDVFGWTIWYDNELAADYRFPPSGAPDQALVHLIVLESGDPQAGKLGLLSYAETPFALAATETRTVVRMGEPILVLNTDDIAGVHDRASAAGATIVTPPVDWTVPGADGAPVALCTVSMFDPNGIYIEVSAR